MKKIISAILCTAMLAAPAAVFADEAVTADENPELVTSQTADPSDTATADENPELVTSQTADPSDTATADENPELVTSQTADPSGVTVYINGAELVADVPAQIINDRTMVPMRAIFEALGASVTWIPEQQGIIATSGSKLIAMVIGSQKMSVMDIAAGQSTEVTLDTAPTIVNDRTLVPVRAISEALGCTVDWDGDTRTVTITK